MPEFRLVLQQKVPVVLPHLLNVGRISIVIVLTLAPRTGGLGVVQRARGALGSFTRRFRP
jgi:hypothetical protein